MQFNVLSYTVTVNKKKQPKAAARTRRSNALQEHQRKIEPYNRIRHY